MAKHQITHSCGHTATHQIYGKFSERERREKYLAGTLCAECYQAELTAKRAAESAKAAAASAEQGLPPITGSDKQIAWAESIRARMLSDAAADMATAAAARGKIEAHPNAAILMPAYEIGIEAGNAVLAAMMGQSEAKWWIDRRDLRPVRDAIDAAYKGAAK